MPDKYIQSMRHQILKQKQAIAHNTIQPLARLMTLRTEQSKNHAEIPSFSEMEAHRKEWYDDQNHNFMLKDTKRSKIQLTGAIFHQNIREKQWNTPSLDKNTYNKSQKLVAKQSIKISQHSDRGVRPSINLQKIEQNQFRSQSKKQEHVQYLLKANQNLRNLQGKSNSTLLRSIEILKNNERHYLPNIQIQPQLTSTRKDNSLIMLQTLEATDLPEVIEESSQIDDKRQKFLRNMKQEAAIRFKQKIKVKQSRRHIYRTLKNKNDALNKIKMKTHHCTPKKDYSNPEIRQIQELQLLRVHCPQGKKNGNNIRSSNFRSLTKTYYQNLRELRIQTKQGQLQGRPTFELRTTKCQFLSNDIQTLNQTYKKKSGIEAYEQIAMRLKKNHYISPSSKQSKQYNNKNVFRALTPWHFEQQ